jgi:phosphoribosylformylglycinamidine synthase
MADAGGFGIELDLDHASLADTDLPDRVAACSETQERFAWAVPRRVSGDILKIYNETYELGSIYEGAGARVIGTILKPVEGEKRMYRLRRGAEMLVDVPVELITEGVKYDRPGEARPFVASDHDLPLDGRGIADTLVELMGSEHLCSRRELYTHYDSEVQARTAMKPGSADAGLVMPVPGLAAGLALTVDGNPRISRIDPYMGGVAAVVESVRNLACVGGIPVAVTDCLNYGNPEQPEVFWEFEEGVRGIGDACRGIGRLDADGEALPVVSGNVSFYNQSSTGRAISPSPIVCGMGIVADVARSRSLSLTRAGNPIYRVGNFDPSLGGSVLAHVLDPGWRAPVPGIDYEQVRAELRTVLQAHRSGWADAIHDIADGGLLSAITEMALGPQGRLRNGANLDLSDLVAEGGDFAACFGESGGFIVEVDDEHREAFEAAAREHGARCLRIGSVAETPTITVTGLEEGPATIELEDLARACEATMPQMLSREEA